MRSVRQHTLKQAIGCVGVGLHSGLKVRMTLHPAEAGSGIHFRRSDLGATVPADFRRVCDTTLCTAIAGDGGAKVATVEHLMAALAGCGVDNALIELSGPEVPIMDGSAAPFVHLIRCAGLAPQEQPRRVIRVLKPVEVVEDGKWARLAPAREFSVRCEIAFDRAIIARQRLSLAIDPITFETELAPARTFGFAEEVAELWRRGLALGGSLRNAVVVSGNRILNEEGLRFRNEFVRHKALDCVGDLSLAGRPILARFEGYCPGHRMNHHLLQALFARSDAWEIDELDSEPARDEAWEKAPRRVNA